MIIECSKCNTKFKLDDSKVPEKGAKVRCKKCQHVFKVERPGVENPAEKTVSTQPVPPPPSEESTGTPAEPVSAGGDEFQSPVQAEKGGFWEDDTFEEEGQDDEFPSVASFDEELKETFLGREEEASRDDEFEMDFKIPDEAEKEVEGESSQREEDFGEESIVEEESFPHDAADEGSKSSSYKRPLGLAIVLLAVIILALYMTQGDQVSSFLQSFKSTNENVEERGSLGLSGLKGYYVVNKNEGRVFVIEGKVVNPWNFSITSNGVKGSVFDDKGAKVDEKFVFPNTIFSKQQLRELPPDALERTLRQHKDVHLEPGISMPFMVVFSNVPENLSEFEAEVSE